MKTRDSCWRRYKIQETLYIGQWRLSPLQNRHHGTSHSSPNCHRQTCHTFLNLIDGLKSLPLSKVILVLGKDKNCRVPNMGFGAAESPGWFDVLPNTLCVRCDAWAGVLSWWGCQPPVAYSCLNHPVVSVEECPSLTQNRCRFVALYAQVILNTTTTPYTCSINGVYHPHWLVQWGRHHSHMSIPVHSPWMPGYIDAMQTILVVLAVAQLFPNRPRKCNGIISDTRNNAVAGMQSWEVVLEQGVSNCRCRLTCGKGNQFRKVCLEFQIME